jgi:GTP cyclohydrolase I
MVPIIGKAHVAYLPDRRVVGISTQCRLRTQPITTAPRPRP